MPKILALIAGYANRFLAGTAWFFYCLGAPFAFLLYLALHPGKYGENWREKLGYVPLRDLSRPCLLIHAVSVGEAIAARTLIEAFRAEHPDWRIMLSVSTATGRQVAAGKYGAENVVYFPLDCGRWVNRFFQYLRPQMIVLMELEIWPVFLNCARNFHIPVIVANARITAGSAAQYAAVNRWPFLRPHIAAAFNTPARWLAQTEEYAERLESIGVDRAKITVGGNLKFDQIPTELRAAEGAAYREAVGAESPAVRVIVAGSTHPGEDEAVLNAWQTLRSEFPGLKLVLAPRHPHRIPEVKAAAEKLGSTVLRSVMKAAAEKGEKCAAADIVIIDTMGELAKFYAAADAVFVGGTLLPHGGQNMAEPCGLAKPTIIGSSFHNFSETVAALQEAEGITIIENAGGLTPALGSFLRDPAAAAAKGEKARETLRRLAGASRKTAAVLGEVYGSLSGI